MLCSSFSDTKKRYVFILCIILFFQVIQTISILFENNPLRSILMTFDWVVLLIVRAEGKICFTTQTSFPWEIKQVVVSRNVGCFFRLYLRWTPLYKIFVELVLACEQALLFGRVKRVSRERASERRSREGQNKRPLARAFSRGSLRLPK